MSRCPHVADVEAVLPLLDEGSEHAVFLELDTDDVVKVTKPGLYGEYYYVMNKRVYQANSTPTEYLVRLHLVAEHFGLSQSALGVTGSGQIVSRQPFIAGDPPMQEEVDEFLFTAGLTPVKQNCWLWKGAVVDGIEPWLGDARADNFVKTAKGMVPIDIRMWQVPTC